MPSEYEFLKLHKSSSKNLLDTVHFMGGEDLEGFGVVGELPLLPTPPPPLSYIKPCSNSHVELVPCNSYAREDPQVANRIFGDHTRIRFEVKEQCRSQAPRNINTHGFSLAVAIY